MLAAVVLSSCLLPEMLAPAAPAPAPDPAAVLPFAVAAERLPGFVERIEPMRSAVVLREVR